MLTMARVYIEFEELGVSRSRVSLLWMFGSLGAAFGTPFYGMAIDRWGARFCIPFALCGLSCAMVTLANARPGPGIAMLPLAFFMMRSCANGAVSPFTQNVVNQWFNKRRGRAIALNGVLPMFISSFPLIGTAKLWQDALDTFGWRQAHLYCALIPVCVAVPVRLLLFSTPESVGCVQDGTSEPVDGRKPQPQTPSREKGGKGVEDGDGEEEDEPLLYSPDVDSADLEEARAAKRKQAAGGPDGADWTRREALGTLPVYLLCIDKFFAAIIGAGCSQVFFQVLQEHGAVGVDIATHVVMPQGLMQSCLPLITGWLRDRGVKPKFLVAVSSFLVAVAPFTAVHVRTPLLAVVYGMNVGGVWGIKGTMSGIVYADFYGRKHLGSIMALDSAIGLVGTAVGPLYIQTMRELQGSYDPVFYTLTLMPCVTAILALIFLNKPKRKPTGGARP